MFINAVEKAAEFTRPMHFIYRTYESEEVRRASATLFFVNSEGWALTCKHVADLMAAGPSLLTRLTAFENALKAGQGHRKERQLRKELERKFGMGPGVTVELDVELVECFDGTVNFTVIPHPRHDLALLKFETSNRLLCTRFPTFARDATGLKQGKFLVRLGFPFPEFTNYTFDPVTQRISWTRTSSPAPRFPIEGMVTRLLAAADGSIRGFETSTPGLKGQSGGPAFDSDGRVWGMQSATTHLDLDFDVDQEVLRNGQMKRIKDSALLHVGNCIHLDVMKTFMRDNGVTFAES